MYSQARSFEDQGTLGKEKKKRKMNGRTQNNKTKSYIKEKRHEPKPSDSYAMGTVVTDWENLPDSHGL